MATLKTPKAVIFDWDNTLVNTWPMIHHALHHTFVKYGLVPWTLEETKARVGQSARDHFPKLFGDKWEEAGKTYQLCYLNNHLAQLESLPLSEDVLKFLHDKGVYMAVVSNKTGSSLRKEAEFIGWGKYFRKLVGSKDAQRDKPHPDPVHMALEGSGIVPGDDVWFIGDSTVDLECARNTTCIPILYGDGEGETHPREPYGIFYKGHDAHFHAPTHKELLELFRHVM